LQIWTNLSQCLNAPCGVPPPTGDVGAGGSWRCGKLLELASDQYKPCHAHGAGHWLIQQVLFEHSSCLTADGASHGFL